MPKDAMMRILLTSVLLAGIAVATPGISVDFFFQKICVHIIHYVVIITVLSNVLTL